MLHHQEASTLRLPHSTAQFDSISMGMNPLLLLLLLLPACLQGVLEHMVLDPSAQNWLVTGSTRGQLQLWDIRFRLPVNTWYHPTGAPVARLALATAQPQRLGLRQGAAVGPLLYVAAGENEVGLWDVAEARCLQVSRLEGLAL